VTEERLTKPGPLSFCSISALDRPLAAAAAVARGAGCEGLEVTARPPHLDPEAGAGAARDAGRAVRAEGVDVVAYGSYLGRFGQVGHDLAKREVTLAAALEAPLLRVWAEPQDGAEQGFGAVVALLQATADMAAHENVTVVIERHLGSHADTPARIARLLEAIGRSNVALNYQVLDFLPPEQASRQADDAAELVGQARYFHLKNYRANPDPSGPLLPGAALADGVLSYPAILRSALSAGYAGPLTIEFLSMEPVPVEQKLAADAAFVRGILADLAAS
jgi:sugar phosphate isomerase/epimerase